MATTTCNIRMDEQLKERFDATARRIGVPTSTAFNIFARKFVERRGFPFDVVIDEPAWEPFRTEEEAVEFGDAMVDEVFADETW